MVTVKIPFLDLLKVADSGQAFRIKVIDDTHVELVAFGRYLQISADFAFIWFIIPLYDKKRKKKNAAAANSRKITLCFCKFIPLEKNCNTCQI